MIPAPGKRIVEPPTAPDRLPSFRGYFERRLFQGGPNSDDYAEFTSWLNLLSQAIKAGSVSSSELGQWIDSAGAVANSRQSMQGFARLKPHGYSGDFEIIDRIYQTWISADPNLAKWDRFFRAQAAPRAVRNRKAYFLQWLHGAEGEGDQKKKKEKR